MTPPFNALSNSFAAHSIARLVTRHRVGADVRFPAGASSRTCSTFDDRPVDTAPSPVVARWTACRAGSVELSGSRIHAEGDQFLVTGNRRDAVLGESVPFGLRHRLRRPRERSHVPRCRGAVRGPCSTRRGTSRAPRPTQPTVEARHAAAAARAASIALLTSWCSWSICSVRAACSGARSTRRG